MRRKNGFRALVKSYVATYGLPELISVSSERLSLNAAGGKLTTLLLILANACALLQITRIFLPTIALQILL